MRIGEKQEFEAIEPGVYPAELIDYTDTRPDGTPLMSNGYQGGDPKPQWKFKFELLDYQGESGRQVSAWINKPLDMDNVAPNANITLLAQALIPTLSAADEWDLPDLLHKRCRLQVESYKKQDGSEGTKIGKYYPIKTKQAAPPQRQPVAAGRAPPSSETEDDDPPTF